jgi:peptide-methionine (S)-S-oxide reductase
MRIALVLVVAMLAAACSREETAGAMSSMAEAEKKSAATGGEGAEGDKAPAGFGDVATFGGGCFWCTEAVFLRLEGVHSVESGYSGGKTANPTYKQVCGGDTGHAEVIQVRYDPAKVSSPTSSRCSGRRTTRRRRTARAPTRARSTAP